MLPDSNRRTICMMMTGAVLSLPAASLAAPATGATQTLPPGVHRLTLPRTNGAPVHYAISIPADYAPGKAVPLVLALHFGVGQGSADGAGNDVLEILVGPGLAELGAIIVAPDSVKGNWSTPENEKAVNELLDTVLAHYSIDTKRIVVTGYSMGGAGSWSFGEKFPQRFSAAIPIAGTPPQSAAGWKLPVLAIHSRNDQVAPFAPTEARIAQLQQAGVNAKLILLSGITHYQTDRFQEPLRQAVPWLHDVWK